MNTVMNSNGKDIPIKNAIDEISIRIPPVITLSNSSLLMILVGIHNNNIMRLKDNIAKIDILNIINDVSPPILSFK